MSNILSLKPQIVWKNFYELTQTPRPSKHEEKVVQHIINFAIENEIEYTVDKTGNIIMRKPASPGMENRKGIILQAHLDMVPQKNSDKIFDFEKDPIPTYIDGDWVTADGVTLGADNGMGLAAILSVFESKELVHPYIEALLTLDEETGMTGAFGLEPGVLKGDILLNLDSEDEGELYVGCAGGLDVNVSMKYNQIPVPEGHKAFKLNIEGLRGGHSGLEIILQRGNSNKLLVRFLKHAQANFSMMLARIDGGSLRNAIPREAHAIVVVPENISADFISAVKKFEAIYKNELSAVEDNLRFTAAECPVPQFVMDSDSQEKAINSLYACPNGVIRMSDSMPRLVETSLNLARVISANGEIKINLLLRSSVNSAKDDLANMVSSVFELAGADVEIGGGYDGWAPNMNSPILKSMLQGYKELYGITPAVKAVHAGLECGIIAGSYPNLDMISIGPTIRYPHSPDEKVEIASVERFWNFLVHTLKNAPLR